MSGHALRPLVVACGALAGELRAVLQLGDLAAAIEVTYLPANLHNRPERILPALAPIVTSALAEGRPVFVAYADCGTGGALDRFVEALPGVSRLPGAHCYELFAGAERFAALHDAEPGTFYLTDFLARHFDALVWCGLGLDRHPALRDVYFANYRRLVHLVQADDCSVTDLARAAASRLGLTFEQCIVGTGGLHAPITAFAHAARVA